MTMVEVEVKVEGCTSVGTPASARLVGAHERYAIFTLVRHERLLSTNKGTVLVQLCLPAWYTGSGTDKSVDN